MDNEDLISTGYFDLGITNEGTHTIESESDRTMPPRVNNAIDAMAGARYFSTMNLVPGYKRVELDQAAKANSAFCPKFDL